MVNYSEVSGPLHLGISYQIKENLRKPIEVVRRSKLFSVNNFIENSSY